MHNNINGPALIRVPDWIPNPLGAYYLYFAHHAGDHIRLAYADTLAGPWQIYPGGVLHLAQSRFVDHIASPDVRVDHANQRIVMAYHGVLPETDRAAITPEIDEYFFSAQRTRIATSPDGLHFTERAPVISAAYLRVVAFKGAYYGVAMPGLLYRSADGLADFERGPLLLREHLTDHDPNAYFYGDKGFYAPPGGSVRHVALLPRGDELFVFFSRAGDCPEAIYLSRIDARSDDWHAWTASEPVLILAPETDYEGADCPLEPSQRGLARARVRQLRDPGIFAENGCIYLLYTTAGEYGIGLAELIRDSNP
ncbi:MAG: hypothetical protein JXA10_06410 [Anaerolineae bacterium]|nr:hypothetical protein [Anaerolineae bacterium]